MKREATAVVRRRSWRRHPWCAPPLDDRGRQDEQRDAHYQVKKTHRCSHEQPRLSAHTNPRPVAHMMAMVPHDVPVASEMAAEMIKTCARPQLRSCATQGARDIACQQLRRCSGAERTRTGMPRASTEPLTAEAMKSSVPSVVIDSPIAPAPARVSLVRGATRTQLCSHGLAWLYTNTELTAEHDSTEKACVQASAAAGPGRNRSCPRVASCVLQRQQGQKRRTGEDEHERRRHKLLDALDPRVLAFCATASAHVTRLPTHAALCALRSAHSRCASGSRSQIPGCALQTWPT